LTDRSLRGGVDAALVMVPRNGGAPCPGACGLLRMGFGGPWRVCVLLWACFSGGKVFGGLEVGRLVKAYIRIDTL